MKSMLAALGYILILLGIIVAVLTPIPGVPIGAPLSIFGAALLARNSARGRAWMQSKIKRHAKISKFIPDRLHDLIFGEE